MWCIHGHIPAGKVYFLEHNPNCGIFYPPDAMGSADYILSLDPHVGGRL
jgi:D-alanine-D-alanine ligase